MLPGMDRGVFLEQIRLGAIDQRKADGSVMHWHEIDTSTVHEAAKK